MRAESESLPEPSDEEIALAAYRIWLQEGSPHGQDREHWLKAREQLMEAAREERPEDEERVKLP